MKKLLIMSTIMIIAMFSFTSITAFADNSVTFPKEDGGKTDRIDVTATYEIDGVETTVYSVDVSWGSMKFVYKSAYKGVWDPTTHQYKDATEAKWIHATDANVIKVTNHSNIAIDLSLTYKAVNDFSNISGTFDNPLIHLNTAEGTTLENAPTERAALTISGDLPSNTESDTEITIGTITITLN